MAFVGGPVQARIGYGGNPGPAPVPKVYGRPEPKMPMAMPSAFKKGGKVKKTGWAKVHKGERVIPAGAAARAMGGKKKTKVPKTKKAKAKVKLVMGEYKRGQLKSSSGKKVTDRKQGVAIALSEAKRWGK
jgi:hypothetical protein